MYCESNRQGLGGRFGNNSLLGIRIVVRPQARSEGRTDLYTVAPTGGSPRRLTSHPADEALASFSPDGRWLYFASDRRDGWQIWRMPAAGGEATRVTRDGGTGADYRIAGTFTDTETVHSPAFPKLALFIQLCSDCRYQPRNRSTRSANRHRPTQSGRLARRPEKRRSSTGPPRVRCSPLYRGAQQSGSSGSTPGQQT